MTSREYGAPQENTNVVLDMATEKLYGAARIPEMCTKRTIKTAPNNVLFISFEEDAVQDVYNNPATNMFFYMQ